MTKAELEVATELVDLDVDRVDAVEQPATGRGFLIMKSAALRKQADDGAFPEGTFPTGEFFKKLMAEIRALRADVAELKAADRQNANSLLRKDAGKPAAPKSRQPDGDDKTEFRPVLKGAAGKKVSFVDIVFANPGGQS